MSHVSQDIGNVALSTGLNGVYVVPIQALDFENPPPLLDGRPITAIAPHPYDADRCYVTTEHPDGLAFLPDPYIELPP